MKAIHAEFRRALARGACVRELRDRGYRIGLSDVGGSYGSTARGRRKRRFKGRLRTPGTAAGGRQHAEPPVFAAGADHGVKRRRHHPEARRGRPTSLRVRNGVATRREHRLPSVHTSSCGRYSHTAARTDPPWLLGLGSRMRRAPRGWSQNGAAAAGRSVTTRRRFPCRPGCRRIPLELRSR